MYRSSKSMIRYLYKSRDLSDQGNENKVGSCMKKVNDVDRDKGQHKAVLRHSIVSSTSDVGKYTTTKPPRLAKSMEGTLRQPLGYVMVPDWPIGSSTYGGIGAQVSKWCNHYWRYLNFALFDSQGQFSHHWCQKWRKVP